MSSLARSNTNVVNGSLQYSEIAVPLRLEALKYDLGGVNSALKWWWSTGTVDPKPIAWVNPVAFSGTFED
ncbi:hypothetical protein H072_2957 [Dactylellina haptotyla CBS 200.50]|uniref:Uncharacterized protein n=1 Tax=Dactylellina haptotyla (strain CBS 200.50) TaxID=1284197 RepID=S8AJN7_DACHA|nr:hypothetical protein H072_2957 [Dactylellina haptotyla CBS 200.50]